MIRKSIKTRSSRCGKSAKNVFSDCFGRVIHFTKKNKYYGLYEFKKGFNTTVTEYIGEYVLVVHRVKYNAFKNIEPVKNLIISSMKKS